MDVDLANETIHAVERGAGFPLVILHGGRLDHRHMLDALEPTFEFLTGWRRLYVDLPGCGKSKASQSVSSQDDVLEMLLEFLGSVLANQRFAVIGESRGSYHARGIVHKRPDNIDGMMLIGAGGITKEAQERLPKHETLVRDDDPPAGLAEEEIARYERLVVQTPETLDRIRRTKTPAASIADLGLETRLQESFEYTFDLDDPSHHFDKPCLIVAGRQDSIAGYWDSVELLPQYPRATIAVLDRAGHSLAWEQPMLLSALTQEWLRRVSESQSARSH
jgi:pimeloyl-ACP methyl ester carboxylesterase